MQLRQYQKDALNWLTERRHGALFADPGIGKTLILLSLLRRLSLLNPALRALIIAPIRVMHNVWPDEIKKWNFDFKASVLHGKEKNDALAEQTDLHLLNPEGLKWFAQQKRPKYDVLVLDESSLFRNPTSVRMKILRRLLSRFEYRYILTGTPTPNSLEDLWSQMYIVDLGETLGTRITHYRNAYFYHETRGQAHLFHLIPGMDNVIWNRVAPLCYRIDAATHLDLPELIINDIMITLPPVAEKTYKDMERKLFAEIDGERRFAGTASVNYGLCRQIAGGALYKERSREYDVLHGAKLQALDELRAELGGKKLLIVFNYRHELERLQRHFRDHCPAIYGGVNERVVKLILQQWNEGKLPLLLAQAGSISHGLNMQSGGNDIVWYTLTDDYDTYEQLNRRLYRSGVKGSVRVHRLIAKGTIDHAVVGLLQRKSKGQQGLFDALKRYKETKQ